MHSGNKQRGVALVIVLLIVAIVVILATEMAGRLQLNVQRVQNIKDSNQAQWYAMSAEAFAQKSLQDLFQLSGDKIHIDQPWSQTFTFPLDGGGIEARLVDMQSCFNLNSLAQEPSDENINQQETESMKAFYRMLGQVQLENDEEIDGFTRETVRDSLADWLDDDQRPRDRGAEDSEYESRQFPYLVANAMMVSQSELRVVNGVAPSWLNQIWHLVCVIPNSNQLNININTLTSEQAPLLAGLTGLTLQQASDLIGRRPRDGWENAGDFLAESVFQDISLTDEQRDWFVVTTEYFILHTRTRYNEATISLSSLFQIAAGPQVSVIRREFGGIE